MKNNERGTIYGHGIPFTVFKNRFGYNVSFDGKWLWRAKTIGEVRRVTSKLGWKLLRNSD